MSGIKPLGKEHTIQQQKESKLSSIDSRTVKIATSALFTLGVAAVAVASFTFTAVTGGAGGVLLSMISIPFFALGVSQFMKHTFETPKDSSSGFTPKAD